MDPRKGEILDRVLLGVNLGHDHSYSVLALVVSNWSFFGWLTDLTKCHRWMLNVFFSFTCLYHLIGTLWYFSGGIYSYPAPIPFFLGSQVPVAENPLCFPPLSPKGLISIVYSSTVAIFSSAILSSFYFSKIMIVYVRGRNEHYATHARNKNVTTDV